MHSSKRYGERAFSEYMHLPKDKRKKESWIVEVMNASMESLQIEQSQSAPTMFSFYRL